MAKRKGIIPDHADKLLFAEDVVAYIMDSKFGTLYEPNETKPYREDVYRAFNGTVREAVDYLFSKVQIAIPIILSGVDEANIWDETAYLHFAKTLEFLHFRKGFEAENFLFLCIEATILAEKFRKNGFLRAPDMAVELIVTSLDGYDMFSGGWDALQETAFRYASKFRKKNGLLTRESVPPESSSTDIKNMFLQSCSSNKHSDSTDPQKIVKNDDFALSETENFSFMLGPQTEGTSVSLDSWNGQLNPFAVAGSFGMAEMWGPESQLVILNNVYNAGKDTEGGNLQASCVSANDNPSEFALELPGMMEDNSKSVNCEDAGTKFHEVESKSRFGINDNLDTEHNEIFHGPAKKVKIESLVTIEEMEENHSDEYDYKSAASTSNWSPSTSSDEIINMSNMTETDLETVNNLYTKGQNKFPVMNQMVEIEPHCS